jgi:ElaB/YqjD/DUF883 family membrane-anchored ribosome-binding protein
MDNQKSTEGKGSDASREGLGSNIGKSQNSGLNQGSSASSNSQSGSSGSLGSANTSPSTVKPATGSSSGSIGGASSQSSGNLGSQQSGSSAAGSSGSLSSSSSGNSALGTSGSSTGSSSGNNLSSTQGSSSQQSSDSGDQSPAQGVQSGIKAAIANVSPDKLHEKIDKVAEGAQPLVDRLVSTAHASVDRISGMLSGASDSLGQRKGQLGETYSAYSEKSTEYVKTNPGTALLVAGAVGFLLAKLLSSSDNSGRRSYRDYRD